MRILITGICGFVGSTLARELRAWRENVEITGIDNFSRPGARANLEPLRAAGIDARPGDVRNPHDLAACGPADWLIDAAANPSVLAGVDGRTGPAELFDHNLVGTLPMLEFCREAAIPFTLLSTSRVYSIPALQTIRLRESDAMFVPENDGQPSGLAPGGVSESFSTEPPLSLYGTSKRCAELLALEYADAFRFPVWINRCGVMAGAGQFGKPDQGIVAYWIHSWAARQPLRYLGFGGHGWQTRDCLHPRDLVPLLWKQFDHGTAPGKPRLANLSGGAASAFSLARLSAWCANEFGPHHVEADGSDRAYDIPWAVLDPALATTAWDWHPQTTTAAIFAETAAFARHHPDWIAISRGE